LHAFGLLLNAFDEGLDALRTKLFIAVNFKSLLFFFRRFLFDFLVFGEGDVDDEVDDFGDIIGDDSTFKQFEGDIFCFDIFEPSFGTI
jgi:hypothetical protein